jgi:hypothetical protein
MDIDLELAQKLGFGGLLLLLVWKVGWGIVAALKETTAALNHHTTVDLAHHNEVKLELVALRTEVKQGLDLKGAVQEAVDEVSGVHDTPDWRTPAGGISKRNGRG